MKYTRLTKEQFEELHLEFANFLATQNIDKAEWEKLKTEKPEIAEQELDIFSDLIWEGALNKTQYVEHISQNHIFLFKFSETNAQSIVIINTDQSLNFLSKDDFQWALENLSSDKIEIKTGTKSFENKNEVVFTLIQQGAIISNGTFYNTISVLLNP